MLGSHWLVLNLWDWYGSFVNRFSFGSRDEQRQQEITKLSEYGSAPWSFVSLCFACPLPGTADTNQFKGPRSSQRSCVHCTLSYISFTYLLVKTSLNVSIKSAPKYSGNLMNFRKKNTTNVLPGSQLLSKQRWIVPDPL